MALAFQDVDDQPALVAVLAGMDLHLLGEHDPPVQRGIDLAPGVAGRLHVVAHQPLARQLPVAVLAADHHLAGERPVAVGALRGDDLLVELALADAAALSLRHVCPFGCSGAPLQYRAIPTERSYGCPAPHRLSPPLRPARLQSRNPEEATHAAGH